MKGSQGLDALAAAADTSRTVVTSNNNNNSSSTPTSGPAAQAPGLAGTLLTALTQV
jgi:hypothetical protein